MLISVIRDLPKIAMCVLVCVAIESVVAPVASAVPTTPVPILPAEETATPVLDLPVCTDGELSVDISLLNDKLEKVKSHLDGSKLVQWEAEQDMFLSAAPALMRGSCMAIESASRPSQNTLDALYKDYLGRHAMYEWKYHSGIFNTLKRSGSRANLSCRVGEMSPADMAGSWGDHKPKWDYCCRIDLCVNVLTY
jgi:hypothetical protein